MRYSQHIKPLSYFKDHTARILDEIAASGEPMIITRNGAPSFVVQDIISYEQIQETFALLKLLAMGRQQVDNGWFRSADDVFAERDAEDGEK